ncbi:hypothetical protein [uncultured Paraglaciecola sp.]|uniref:hypothetical protein n=1 Tax=uncultured Paraglaciecola sp. TaxID=1765024 RepID=UPI0025989C84|nr:hypothetical protein [uncultured Paraglaciecola sp.]
MKARWGYVSKSDGASYQLDLCENCFNFALSALQDHGRSIRTFDVEEVLTNDKFG